MRISRHLLAATFALAACGAPLLASAQQTPEQLKAAYDETVRQLQESQDRKNQLANENERLKARVAELDARLVAIEAEARQADFLRAQSAAWSAFLQRYPVLLKRFEAVLAGPAGLQAPASQAVTQVVFFDPEWPFSVVSVISVDDATTAPTTAPATTPAATRPSTLPASAPANAGVLTLAGGTAAHWCALCAAAASRAAVAARPSGDGLDAWIAPAELIHDFPPR